MNALNQIIDGISAGCFKKLENGQYVFFPNGVLGGGYAVPDEAAALRVRQSLRRLWYVILAFCAVSGPVVTWLFTSFDIRIAGGVAVAVLVMIAFGTRMAMNRTAAGLEKVDTRLKFREALQTQAIAFPRWYSIFQVVFSGLMLVVGFFMIRDAATDSDWMVGVFATSVFALLLIAALYGLWANMKAAHKVS